MSGISERYVLQENMEFSVHEQRCRYKYMYRVFVPYNIHACLYVKFALPFYLFLNLTFWFGF